MKGIIFLLVLLGLGLNAQSLDSLKIDKTYLYYHKIESKTTLKKGLIIYMHGGVSQFEGLEKPVEASVQSLVEDNPEFIPIVLEQGYDLILPIAYNKYNWLNESESGFIVTLQTNYRASYDKIIISGFSDGGTGAYQIFYTNPELFDGAIFFNGYPQLNNFYKKVDYTKVTDKPLIYASTFSDKQIAYEFLMIAYRRQKMINKNTFFSLTEGDHSFKDYSKTDIQRFLNSLETENSNPETPPDSIWVYPPIDGWLNGDTLLSLHSFRKKYGKPYGMAKDEYARDDISYKDFSKLISEGSEILILPVLMSREDLRSRRKIEFTTLINGKSDVLILNNWLVVKTWE